MAIFSEIIRLLNLEVIVSAVIVKHSFVSIQYNFGILVKLRLEKIILFCKDFQCTVNVMELAVRLFKKLSRKFKRRPLGSGINNPGEK